MDPMTRHHITIQFLQKIEEIQRAQDTLFERISSGDEHAAIKQLAIVNEAISKAHLTDESNNKLLFLTAKDHQTYPWSTFLHMAAQNNMYDLVIALVDAGLPVAMENGNKKIASELTTDERIKAFLNLKEREYFEAKRKDPTTSENTNSMDDSAPTIEKNSKKSYCTIM